MNRTYNSKLEDLIVAKKLSKTKLAEVLCISRPSLYNKLKNPGIFYLTEITKIANLLEVSLEELLEIIAEEVE